MTELKQQIIACKATYTKYWLSQLNKLSKQPLKLAKLEHEINYQLQNLAKRKELISKVAINYPSELPISAMVTQLKEIIKDNQVTIVCGETGSGKTTQLPKILLELAYATTGVIGHTQPRRIAAKSLASRINQELGDLTDNQLVGYKMRFHDRSNPLTAIKLMTDGILLQEIQHDKLLLQYSALIIDEVHERSLNIDFILGYVKQLLVKRPDLKIIITSATLEIEKLVNFFNNAPIVNISGKTYPVDIIYQALEDNEQETSLNQAVYQAIVGCLNVERGNGLVFLPGEREIKHCLGFLKKTELKQYELLALYARQNNEEQSQIFKQNGRLKIILATNIAETSLTIPGIKFVIDSGLARIKRYSVRSKVEQLQLENIAKASAKQRAGRAGRVSHGMCVRLFNQDEFNLRKEFVEPELLRSNLANVILRLLSLNLGEPSNFPFLDVPEDKAFNDGMRSLYQIGALNEQQQISGLGRELAKIPVDVQLARVLLAAASDYNWLSEALIIVAFLAIQDPREFPLEQQQLVRERHSIWADKQSEFMQILNLWRWYQQELVHKKSNKKLLEVCHKQFVSLLRLREWQELYRQLKETMLNLGYKENQLPADYINLHRAILSGFVLNLGQKDLVGNYYLSTNSRKFYLHPAININSAKWVIALNLFETTRLYARNCAYVEPQWLDGIADHLYKYTYSYAHWDKKRGEVVATKSFLLYGLLIKQTKVSFAQIDPVIAKESMLREGIIPNNVAKNYAFIIHNQKVLTAISKLEDKLRASFLVLEDELYNFYHQILPATIFDIPSLEQYLNKNPQVLKINQEQFIQRLALSDEHLQLYPDSLQLNGQNISLKYVFNPHSNEDGLVVILSLAQLAKVDNCVFDWLVTGMRREKIAELIKSLPKAKRVVFNPIQDSINDFLEYAKTELDLFVQFMAYAKEKKQLELDYQQLKNIQFPVHLRCHFRVIENKELLASGDDLALLKQQLAPVLDKIIIETTAANKICNISGFIAPMTNLGEKVCLNNGQLTGYTSLLLERDLSVSYTVLADLRQATISTLRGFVQLIKLDLAQQYKYLLTKKIADFKAISLALHDVYLSDELMEALAKYLVNQAVLNALSLKLPRSELEFTHACQVARESLAKLTPEFNQCLNKIGLLYTQLKREINVHPLNENVLLQLDDLIYPRFLAECKWQFLVNYPRYLQALLIRLEKYHKNPSRDQLFAAEINQLYDKWYNHVDELELKHKIINPALYEFKYKIEELRISLFAQELKTLYPVSSKRLMNELDALYLNNLME